MNNPLAHTVLVVPLLVLLDCAGFGAREVFIPAVEIKVVDGDTFNHGSDRYRLLGFDTPETHFAKCSAEYELGQKAKQRFSDLLHENGGVNLRIDPRVDRYGRFLARASVNGQEIGAVLISEGLARPYAGGKRQPWCSSLEMNRG